VGEIFAPSPSPTAGSQPPVIPVIEYVNAFTFHATESTMLTALYIETLIVTFYTLDVLLNLYSHGWRDYWFQWHGENDFSSRRFQVSERTLRGRGLID